jgi:hypothetical protein
MIKEEQALLQQISLYVKFSAKATEVCCTIYFIYSNTSKIKIVFLAVVKRKIFYIGKC